MPKTPQALLTIPPAAAVALKALGENLRVARVRRRESQREWAKRLGVSVPTLIRMEKGDPAVSMGVYATALWLLNRHDALAAAADPKEDLAALEAEVRTANLRNTASGGERD